MTLAAEVNLTPVTKMCEEDRAQAAQHVRAYLPDFTGVVVSFGDTSPGCKPARCA